MRTFFLSHSQRIIFLKKFKALTEGEMGEERAAERMRGKRDDGKDKPSADVQ